MNGQQKIWNEEENDWRKEWAGMPEYDNVLQDEPFITATFKFRNQKDFDIFNYLVKKYLYNNEKVFDGMQRKNVKSTWFPLQEKANKYLYINES